MTILRLLISLRLELILISSNRSRATHALELAFHVVMHMLVIITIHGCAHTSTSTGWAVQFLVVEEG